MCFSELHQDYFRVGGLLDLGVAGSGLHLKIVLKEMGRMLRNAWSDNNMSNRNDSTHLQVEQIGLNVQKTVKGKEWEKKQRIDVRTQFLGTKKTHKPDKQTEQT